MYHKLLRNATAILVCEPEIVRYYCNTSEFNNCCSIPRFRSKNNDIYLEKMSIKHLASGSTEPPLVEGEFRLYSMRFCPFAQRIHLVLNAKKVPYNVVYINLVNKPEWYLEKFPAGKVPALLYNGEFLYESLLLADFLNEKFPDPPLYPKEPLQKLKDKLLIENFGKVMLPFHSAIMKPEFDIEDYKQFLEALKIFEKELQTRKSDFFNGNAPGMVDYMIWPWFERLESLPLLIPNVKIPYDDYPALKTWVGSMKDQKPVKEFNLPPEKYGEFYKHYKTGNTLYDELL